MNDLSTERKKGVDSCIAEMPYCSGFSWDRVNFHKKLVGLTQIVNQMGYSTLCGAMLSIQVGSWLKEMAFCYSGAS